MPPGDKSASASAEFPGLPDAGLLELVVTQIVDYAIFVIDPAGNIASWNPGAQRIKGYSSDEIIGAPYSLFFSPEDRSAGRPEQILSEARARGRFEEEGWRVRKDGSRFWASVVITALLDSGGRFKGYAKVTRDLTERRQAEEQARQAAAESAARRQAEIDERDVRRSRDQLTLILRNIAEGVTAETPGEGLIFANDAAAHLCDFDSAEAILAAPPEEFLRRFEVSAEDGTPLGVDQLPGKLALRGITSNTIVRVRSRRTGEERWSFVSAAPVVDATGTVELAVSVFRDFTDRRRTEAAWQFLSDASVALGTSLDYKATLTQVANLAVPQIADWCGVDVLDTDGRLEQLAVAHVDPQKRELAREFRRRWPPPADSPSYRVIASGAPDLLAEITDAMIEASTSDPEQKRILGELGLRSAMVVPLIVGDRPFGVVSFVTAESGRRYGEQDLMLAMEITRRASLAIENARAYTEAKVAVETRDNFLAIASHELRTPLSALSVLTSSLVRAAGQGRLMQLGAEALKERLLKAERQTRQLTRLVERLLDVSRLSTRDLQLDREPVDFAEVVREVVARYEDAIADAGSRIDVELAGSTTVGYWDRGRLDQVVANLLGNAIKYGGGAAINVSVSSGTSGHIRLTVKDEGPGVAQEDQARIFEQFERAAPNENLPGMGLGLWLVRRIVAAHGGTVTLDSRPGEGAAFTVVLPTSLRATAEAAQSVPELQTWNGKQSNDFNER